MNFYSPEEFEQVQQIFFEEFFQEWKEPVTEEEKNFILQEAKGTMEKKEQIDDCINRWAKNWTIDRMSKVDASILRLAVYELSFSSIPVGVVINEAVELSKEFSSEQAPSFVNGILGKIASLPKETEKMS